MALLTVAMQSRAAHSALANFFNLLIGLLVLGIHSRAYTVGNAFVAEVNVFGKGRTIEFDQLLTIGIVHLVHLAPALGDAAALVDGVVLIGDLAGRDRAVDTYQTTINLDNTSVTTSSVQYVQTGVILDVVPRINPGGLVYMDIQQQVSDASKLLDSNGNPSISTRAVSTQVAVQSGQTVLLGGLIKQNEADSQRRVPWLGRVPGLGWLFSDTQRSHARTELIVLITPKVVSDANTARQVTDEYRQQLQLIRPDALAKPLAVETGS